jgi:hypothetical protein
VRVRSRCDLVDVHTTAITGSRTGREWRYHVTADKITAAGWGRRFRVQAVDDETWSYYHEYDQGDFYAAELPQMRNAVAVADLPEVAACAYTCTLIDVVENEYVLGSIWELADISLHDFFGAPVGDRDAAASEVGTNVGGALDVLHGLGLVHLDVAPNNVLRVGGVWQLGDFGICQPKGAAVPGHPKPPYRHPERTEDSRARFEFDRYGLEKMIERLRSDA